MSENEKVFVSARDKQAIAAYENHCKGKGEQPSDAGRAEWVREWRQLDLEHNQDGMDEWKLQNAGEFQRDSGNPQPKKANPPRLGRRR